MKLIEASVRYPVSVTVVVILCVIFGVISLARIPVQMIPTIDRPRISVQTPYPGAGPLEVEEEITNRQEELLNTVEGLREMTSNSTEGRSQITLEYDWGVDKDVARLDVSEKLAAVRNIPDDAEESIILAANSDAQSPIGFAVMTADRPVNEVRPLAEDVIWPQLQRVPGVGQVWFFGGEEREVHVNLNLGALAQRGISVAQVRAALIGENRNIKAGSFDEGKIRYGVRTVGRYRHVEDVEQTIVARDAVGPIRIRDIATVQINHEQPRFTVRQNGQEALIFGIFRKSGSNTLEVMQSVRALLDRMNTQYANQSVKLKLVYDSTIYIEEAMDLVTTNLLIGAVLATIVLLFFLRSARAVLVLFLAIPISIITTFAFIYFFGRSLNIISLAGLTFATGMVLDSAIVVVENIFRHRELGKGPYRAAYDGAVEVWGAILASTLTTLAVFIPIILIEDEAGQIFRDIAIAISIAVALSLLVAVTVIPMLAARVLPDHTPNADVDKHRMVHFVSEKLLGLLRWLFEDRSRQAAVVGGILVVAGVLGWALWQKPDYLPKGNRNIVFFFVRTPPGYNIKQNERIVRLIEETVLPRPEVARMFSVVRQTGAFMGAVLKDEYKSKQQILDFMDDLKPALDRVPGAEVQVYQPALIRSGGIGRAPLQVLLQGDGLEQLARLSDGALDQIKRVPGVKGANPSFELGKPEYTVEVDRVRAAELGLTVHDVGTVVEMAVNGILAGTFDDGGREIDLRVRVPTDEVTSSIDLSKTVIYAPSGQIVQLGDLSEIRSRRGPTQIEHTDMDRSLKLFVRADETVPLGEMITRLEEALDPIRASLPLGYSVRLSGRADDLDRMLNAFLPSLVLALIITYLLLASLFESFVMPAVIFFSVPFAASGGILALSLLQLFDQTVKLDTITMLGFVILLGVVVNNAILIVHQALQRADLGESDRDAILGSVATRVRPILMTMITTVFGMSPLVFATGSGSELYRGLGAILVGGLAISTVFTLIIVPTVLDFAMARRASEAVDREAVTG
jgi:HAE1 family hydrophobic/amphiphilic exporter-1